MTNYTYKARDATGKITSGVINAKSRAAVIHKLKDQGLLPVSVTANKNGGASRNVGRNPNFAIKLVAGVLVLGAVVFSVLSYLSSNKGRSFVEPIPCKQVVISKLPIDLTTQMVVSASSTPTQPGMVEHVALVFGDEALQSESINIEIRPPAIKDKPNIFIPKKRIVSDLRPGKTNSLPSGLSSGTERILNTLISSSLGGPPPPLLSLPPKEAENLMEVLNRDIVVFSDDDELAVAKKENLAAAKEILKAYLSEGGSPEEFMSHYRDILVKAYEDRKQLQKELRDLVKAGKMNEAEKFYENANEILSEEGYLPLRMP